MNNMNYKSLNFNIAGCGIAIPRNSGNLIGLSTRGITSCVVLQVFSNAYVFVAHLTDSDTEVDNLSSFCDRVKDAFQEKGSSITGCTVWYTQNIASKNHANAIYGNVVANLEVNVNVLQIESRNKTNTSFEISVLVNGDFEVSGNVNASEVNNSNYYNIDYLPPDEQVSIATDIMTEAGYHNGFAVAISTAYLRESSSEDQFFSFDEQI